jgi:c-di-GMP-binding flagellar brake protein YcgR
MEEKRRYRRFRVDVMEINGRMVFANNVTILDISAGGVSMKADRRLNIGTEYALRIEEGGTVVLTVKGTIVWSVLSETREVSGGNIIPVYTAGMKFTDISHEKSSEIINFIKAHEQEVYEGIDLSRINGLRHKVRVHINAPDKSSLNFSESYRVKILSLSGMLIGSDHPVNIESILPMEITLPEYGTIGFMGRVASCRLMKDREHGDFGIGIEFKEMQEEGKERLKGFILMLHRENEDE